MEVVVQRKRSGAAGPGIKAWLHAGRDAITLSATSHRNFAHEVEQLLGRAQELRQAGQDEDADALLDKGAARGWNRRPAVAWAGRLMLRAISHDVCEAVLCIPLS